MAGYTTVGRLIEYLKEQENLDAPVIYQYYLAEHFDTSEEVFTEVAREFESLIPCSDAYESISEATRRLT
jgi:hypothetical protein